jgi:putative lipoic acid-binding regulatory protein
MSGNEEEETAPERGDSDDSEPIFETKTVRIDDGGSDLDDRFKYKVHALMGTYDPQNGTDNERQDGNILNGKHCSNEILDVLSTFECNSELTLLLLYFMHAAMLNFPVRYTFNAVGRTGGDEELRDVYVEEVKELILATSGDEDGLECQVTPRGKNFTKIQCAVEVQSAAMITLIYDNLEKLDRTVMRF